MPFGTPSERRHCFACSREVWRSLRGLERDQLTPGIVYLCTVCLPRYAQHTR